MTLSSKSPVRNFQHPQSPQLFLSQPNHVQSWPKFQNLSQIFKKNIPHPHWGKTFSQLNHVRSSSNFQDIFKTIYQHDIMSKVLAPPLKELYICDSDFLPPSLTDICSGSLCLSPTYSVAPGLPHWWPRMTPEWPRITLGWTRMTQRQTSIIIVTLQRNCNLEINSASWIQAKLTSINEVYWYCPS